MNFIEYFHLNSPYNWLITSYWVSKLPHQVNIDIYFFGVNGEDLLFDLPQVLNLPCTLLLLGTVGQTSTLHKTEDKTINNICKTCIFLHNK